MYQVRISDDALESMTLAAIEAYCLGDGRKDKDELETFGYIWGYTKRTPEHTIYHLTKLSLSLSAKRHQDWVMPNPKAARLKNEVVSRWSPNLTLLGDFHTHPYKNLDEVRRNKGFEFSECDFKSFSKSDLVWKESGGAPIMLAMAVCRMKRVHESFGEQLRGNICSYRVGEFRFWLNATAGYLEEDKRCWTGNTHSKVFLDLNSRFFNLGSDRIEQ